MQIIFFAPSEGTDSLHPDELIASHLLRRGRPVMALSGHTEADRYLSAFGAKRTFRMGPPPCFEDACGVIFELESAGETASAAGKLHSTSGSIQSLGYLLTALRRQQLASDKLILQLATFLRSHDLFLELSVRIPRTPRALTADQVRHSGKKSTDGR